MADITNDSINERLSLERELIELLNRRQGIENDTLNDARDLSNVIRSQTQELSFQNYEKNKLRSLSRDIAKIAEQSYSRDVSVVGTNKDINNLVKSKLDLETKIIGLDSFRNQILSDDLGLQNDINSSIQEQIVASQKLIVEIGILETQSRKVANNFGVKTFGALEDITKSIPGLRNLSQPFSEAAGAARTVAQEGASGAKALIAGGKSLASSLGKALGPAVIIAGLAEAFLSLDTMIGNTAKNLGISYRSAAALNSEFVNIANNSGNIFVTTKGINESFNQINAALGTNGVLSADILVSQTELVKQAGYSVEAATMLSKLSLATGKPTKDIASNFLGSAKALNLVNGTAINEKQLLEDISGLSKDTLATFASQPGKLAEAAFEARKLGLDLEKLKGTQSALLDIESSIAAEFEAEVLTGRQLNLEKARFFSLTNDYAGLAKELAAQDITRDSFSKMNVIQQEATAKALGMSASTMGGMLMDQEALTKLTGIEGKDAKEKFNNLVKQVGMEEAKKRIGDETLANQMASASTQDKFNASIEKLKEIFVSLVDPLMPILEIFSTIFELVGGLVKLINPLIQGFGFLVAAATDLLTIRGSGASGSRMEAAAVRLYESTTSDETLKQEQSVQDASTTTGGPFKITNRFGATAITAAGDGVAVSPNIRQMGSSQQQQSPSIDYDKMAQALSKVQVNTNIDGVQISNQLFNKSSAGIAIRKI
jgi:hypothetical protein